MFSVNVYFISGNDIFNGVSFVKFGILWFIISGALVLF